MAHLSQELRTARPACLERHNLRDTERQAFAYFCGNLTAVARARVAVVAGDDRAAGLPVPEFLLDGWAGAAPVALRTLQRAFAEQMTPGQRGVLDQR